MCNYGHLRLKLYLNLKRYKSGEININISFNPQNVCWNIYLKAVMNVSFFYKFTVMNVSKYLIYSNL